MIISHEKIDELEKLCEQGEKLKIVGFNGLGFKFETVGRITKDDYASPAVYDNCVFFEFGNERQSYAPQRTDIFAPFMTDYDKEMSFDYSSLIIDRVELPNGEVVIQNEDSAKYYETAKKEFQKYVEKLKKDGRDIVQADPVTEKLSQMVGQPVIIDGKRKGVLTNCMMVSNNGAVCIDLLDGIGRTNNYVEKETRVTTTDLEGNIELVEVNGKTREECKLIDRIFEDRKNRIIEASNNNIPTGPQ